MNDVKHCSERFKNVSAQDNALKYIPLVGLCSHSRVVFARKYISSTCEALEKLEIRTSALRLHSDGNILE